MRAWSAPLVTLLASLSVTTPGLATPEGEPSAPIPTSRRVASVGIVGATYTAAWAFVAAAWWTGANASTTLHFRDEGAFGVDTYAGGADKLGHLYANYVATRLYDGILEWGGFSRTASLVAATSLTTGFFLAVELKDGYAERYGFSVGDLAANLSGEALALTLELLPAADRAVSLRLSYFPSPDYFDQHSLRARMDLPEDYSGQTYLLCFHLAALPLAQRVPPVSVLRYVDLSLGFSALGFEPVPRTPKPVRQVTSLGVSLNLQRVFDDLLDEPRGERSMGARAVHFANEVIQLPYTRVPIVSAERLGARPHQEP